MTPGRISQRFWKIQVNLKKNSDLFTFILVDMLLNWYFDRIEFHFPRNQLPNDG